MKTMARLATALVATALFAAVASAATTQWKTDKAHTEVAFEIRHFFNKVHGKFTDFDATINFDDQDPSKISVDGTVQATSVLTNNDRRDNHLRTEDFFYVEKYPTLTFKSTKVTPEGKNKFKIAGDLTMRGVTKPVVFDAEYLGSGDISMGGNSAGAKAGFTATTVVNRQDYGIKWNKVLDSGGTMLDDNVTIILNIECDKVQAQK